MILRALGHDVFVSRFLGYSDSTSENLGTWPFEIIVFRI